MKTPARVELTAVWTIKAHGTHRQILERVDPILRDLVPDLDSGDTVELDFRTNHPEAATLRIHKDGSILCPVNPPDITGELVARLRDRGSPVRYCQPSA